MVGMQKALTLYPQLHQLPLRRVQSALLLHQIFSALYNSLRLPQQLRATRASICTLYIESEPQGSLERVLSDNAKYQLVINGDGNIVCETLVGDYSKVS